MKQDFTKWTGRLLAAAMTALCLTGTAAIDMMANTAQADEAAARAFYKGKLFRFMTMGGAGGGFDAYMRTILPFLEKKLEMDVLP